MHREEEVEGRIGGGGGGGGGGRSSRRIKMKWDITSFAKNYEQNGLMFFRYYYGKHLHVNSWQKFFGGQQL